MKAEQMSARDRSAAAWQDHDYTDDQMDKLATAYRVLSGVNPAAAFKLETQMANKTPFGDIELPENHETIAKKRAIRPETGISVALVDIPPHVGKGSGQARWAEFALLVSDMDEEVVDQFTREEIIDILVDRDIIDDPRTSPRP